jgi:hypothetical protein
MGLELPTQNMQTQLAEKRWAHVELASSKLYHREPGHGIRIQAHWERARQMAGLSHHKEQLMTQVCKHWKKLANPPPM